MAPKKVLFFTLSAHGQANCHLAISHELIQRGVEVHLATFKSREKTTVDVSQAALRTAPKGTPPIQFHEVHGAHSSFDQEGIPFPEFLTTGRLTFWAAVRNINWLAQNMASQFPDDNFFQLYYDCIGIIKDVNADIIAVDLLFGPALAACQHSPQKHIVLSPMALKEFIIMAQPNFKGILTLPAMASGHSFPVPWYQVPATIFLSLLLVILGMLDGGTRSLKTRMKNETGRSMLTIWDIMLRRPKGMKVLASSLPELEFHPFYIPPDIVPCGPILRPTAAVSEVDPELANWLSRGPTMLVNLGTFFEWSEDLALEMAKALKATFQAVSNDPKLNKLQVLWKLKKQPKAVFSIDKGSAMYHILGSEIESEHVRIETWLRTSPHSILDTGHVILSVNHAGANSWNEAVVTGVPQVSLPAWLDCYDFAARTTFLGIGVHGNKANQPSFTAEELCSSLVNTISGSFADAYRAKSKELSKLCANGKGGIGRVFAAQYILEECA